MRSSVFSEKGNWGKTEWAISNLLESYHQLLQEEDEISFDKNNFSRLKRARTAYNKSFLGYPDVVNIKQFAKMAGIREVLARKIAQEGHIQSVLHVAKGWQFPKRWVVDYLLSDHYLELMKTLNKNRSGRNE